MSDKDWRQKVGKELPTMGLGALDEGDELVVMFENEGEMRESTRDDWDDALSLHVTVFNSPEDYPAKEDDEQIEVEDEEEYYLMSSSTRFMRSLKSFADNLTGQIAVIRAEGSGMQRTYFVESADEN